MSTSRRQIIAPAKRDYRKIIIYSTLAVLVIVVIIAVALASRVPKSASEAPVFSHLAVGDPAPPFAVATTAGPFDSTKAGKPIFLEVFATWCPHCQRETAVIDNLYAKDQSKVAFVAVSGSATGMDGSNTETQADVVSFAQQLHVNYPIAYDGDLDVAKKYLQGGFPTIVMIGTNGKVAYIDSGEIAESTLQQNINKLK